MSPIRSRDRDSISAPAPARIPDADLANSLQSIMQGNTMLVTTMTVVPTNTLPVEYVTITAQHESGIRSMCDTPLGMLGVLGACDDNTRATIIASMSDDVVRSIRRAGQVATPNTLTTNQQTGLRAIGAAFTERYFENNLEMSSLIPNSPLLAAVGASAQPAGANGTSVPAQSVVSTGPVSPSVGTPG